MSTVLPRNGNHLSEREDILIVERPCTRRHRRLLAAHESYSGLAFATAFAFSPFVLEYVLVVAITTSTAESIARLLVAYPVVCAAVLLASTRVSRKTLGWHNLVFVLFAVFHELLNVFGLWLNFAVQDMVDSM